MVKVVGVSSLVVMLRLLTVGGCGAGSLLVGEEQVQMNTMLNTIKNCFITFAIKNY